MLPGPCELFLEEREHLAEWRPPEDHRTADLVPGVDLAAHVPGREREFACRLQRGELRTPIPGGQLGDAHQLPGVGKVDLVADAFEDRYRATRGRPQIGRFGLRSHEAQASLL